ncbi:hypothetical protein ACQ4PT_003142 [Festuca glaucescens]
MGTGAPARCRGIELQAIDSTLEQSRSGRLASTKSLVKNWQLISAIIVYCIFSLYDTAYYEIFSLWAVNSRKYRGLSINISGCRCRSSYLWDKNKGVLRMASL